MKVMKEIAKENYSIPADLFPFFAKPPLRINESRPMYEAVRASIIETISPRNKYEWYLVDDIVNFSWEIRGLRKDKAATVNLTWKEALSKILEALMDGDMRERSHVAQVRASAYFIKQGREWVVTFLSGCGLTEDAIAAHAAGLRLPELEMIDRRIHRALVARIAIERDLVYNRIDGLWARPGDLLALVDDKVSLVRPISPHPRARLCHDLGAHDCREPAQRPARPRAAHGRRQGGEQPQCVATWSGRQPPRRTRELRQSRVVGLGAYWL
jgi:hypothetical protein